ncbi:MAG: phosphate starvation-inducible protein PhoH [Betaproteobacteria bacterium]|jgi:protein PsiE|nr:phosphate starvation-inducible protein PhoH [Betaproteobacteria bacterium]NBP45487.1 phosphate starvation-inducible protein PhoH [Betaproteobacteria bacterium]
MKDSGWPNMQKLITTAEKGILILIAIFTVYSVCSEMYKVMSTGQITLTDLLLMFIYAEVLGMVAAFYKHNRIPITIPVFIAITALCRLIILQGKGISTVDLIYESGAVLLLAIAALVLRWNPSMAAAKDAPPLED